MKRIMDIEAVEMSDEEIAMLELETEQVVKGLEPIPADYVTAGPELTFDDLPEYMSYTELATYLKVDNVETVRRAFQRSDFPVHEDLQRNSTDTAKVFIHSADLFQHFEKLPTKYQAPILMWIVLDLHNNAGISHSGDINGVIEDMQKKLMG